MKTDVDGALEHVKSELESKKEANEEYLENEEGKDSPNEERTEKYGARIEALESAIGALEDVDLSECERFGEREIEWPKRTLPKEVAGLIDLLNDASGELRYVIENGEPCTPCSGSGVVRTEDGKDEKPCEQCGGNGMKELGDDVSQIVEKAADKVDEAVSALEGYE